MPVINRAAPKPLPPEGPAKLLIEEVTFGKSKEKKTPFFGLSLKDLGSGLTMKDRVYLTPTSSWKVDALCKSAGLILPEGPYRLVTDDLESRIVYGPVVYENQMDGRLVAKLKTFWRKEYALEQAPELELIPDPPGVPGPVKLSPVETLGETEANGASAPPPPSAAAPTATAPTNERAKVNTEPEEPEEADGVSDEELAEAFAYAKALKAKKAAAGVGK